MKPTGTRSYNIRVYLSAARTIAALFSGALVASTVSPAEAVEVETVVENVSRRYDELTDFSAGLWLITKSFHLEEETVYKGRLYSRKPNRFRIEYYEPSDQTVVFDGSSLYFYNPATNQVVLYPVSGITGKETAESTFDWAKKRYDFEDAGEATLSSGERTYKLKLTAKSSDAAYPTIRIWVDAEEWVARRVDLEDAEGNEISYRLYDFKFNRGYGADMFSFNIPGDAEVIRADEIGF